MKLGATLMSLALVALVGCGGSKEPAPNPDSAPRPEAPPASNLSLFIWSEYIDPSVVADFEKKTGTKVQISLFESNDEMMAKLSQGGGISQYDVIIPGAGYVPQLIKLDLLQPLDHARLSNLPNLMDKFKNPSFDPGNKYSAAYLWGSVGLVYRKDKLPDFTPSWAWLFDEKKKGPSFVLMDDMRDMLAVALKAQGASLNSRQPEDLKKAGELMLAAKKSEKCLGFEGGVGGKNKVLAGMADMAVVYNGDGVRGATEDPGVEFVIPQEGASLWVDNMAIPKQAPNPTAAHAFINFILEPEIGARNAAFMKYGSPNQAALAFIPEKERTDPRIYPGPELMGKLEFIEDVGEASALYSEVWTAVKAR